MLSRPWPWYVAGPLIGLTVPALLLVGNKAFGLSSNLRHACAICIPGEIEFFQYDWRRESWNLAMAAGIILGGFIGGVLLPNPEPVAISAAAEATLAAMGVSNTGGLHPDTLFSFPALLTIPGFVLIAVGGFLVGFGTRYAGGCTSGHAIMGLSTLQWPSLVATCCFFAGGLLTTWVILPRLLAMGAP